MKSFLKKYLGKEVKVVIDRALGSKHPNFDMKYPVNYGFLLNTKAPDGDEIDAYILGVDKPVKEFKGKVIAIIHRIDDNDDKLVLAPEGKEYTAEQIRELTNFQEKYFRAEIIR